MIRRILLQHRAPQDREAWQKQYYEHQKHWQRRRLLALESGMGRPELSGGVPSAKGSSANVDALARQLF